MGSKAAHTHLQPETTPQFLRTWLISTARAPCSVVDGAASATCLCVLGEGPSSPEDRDPQPQDVLICSYPELAYLCGSPAAGLTLLLGWGRCRGVGGGEQTLKTCLEHPVHPAKNLICN